ncbi:TIGR00153 family protein [Marinihelvus fidelis]|uniref:TIGR00153 family protein n=1 Tax=Marinihelvus fidelis TaxID=2613842 RepID=A0A5N0T4M9_9GAMM|nr:TIGR00153 family protein [Marinihelvus fidelis]KAA9129863.1 TIGR00153 family protein [Marinihelvus fidelis]
MVGGYLSGIFASSPIGPLQTHMKQVVKCVHELIPFLDAVTEGDREARDASHKLIVEHEHKADDLKKELRLQLPTSLFMPIDRRDMLEILSMQDGVASRVRDVAGIIAGRDMKIPKSMVRDYRKLVKTCIKTCEQALSAISELDELIETGFDNAERMRISNMLVELDAMEHETDVMVSDLCDQLMAIEDKLNPIDAIFLYRVLDKTGAIADRAQQVGSRLQLTLAR